MEKEVLKNSNFIIYTNDDEQVEISPLEDMHEAQ